MGGHFDSRQKFKKKPNLIHFLCSKTYKYARIYSPGTSVTISAWICLWKILKSQTMTIRSKTHPKTTKWKASHFGLSKIPINNIQSSNWIGQQIHLHLCFQRPSIMGITDTANATCADYHSPFSCWGDYYYIPDCQTKTSPKKHKGIQGPVGWSERTHRHHLYKTVRPLQWVSWYDTKQSDGKAPIMLELRGIPSSPLMPWIPGPLLHWVLSMG